MISVIIPTYNREKELLRSLESVRKQTISDIEIIIVDDGSTDSTEKSVRNIKDDRIRFIKHERNRGGGAARNTGIENAYGEYIAFQDSDDVWYENKLEVQLNTLLENNADVVFCKMNRIENGISVRKIPENQQEGFLSPDKDEYSVGAPTIFGKRIVFSDIKFDETLPRLQDLEIIIRIAKKYKIYFCNQVLMDTYFDGRTSAISGNTQKLLEACKLISEKHPDLNYCFPKISKRIARILFSQSNNNDVNKNQKGEMINLAIRFDMSVKSLLKYVLCKLGIYNIIIIHKSLKIKSKVKEFNL